MKVYCWKFGRGSAEGVLSKQTQFQASLMYINAERVAIHQQQQQQQQQYWGHHRLLILNLSIHSYSYLVCVYVPAVSSRINHI